MKHRNPHLSLSVIFLAASVAFASCQWDRSLLRGSEPKLQFARFDQAMEDYLATGNFASWQKLTTDYPHETQTLVEDVLHLGSVESELIGDTLRNYYSDSTLVKLRHDVGHKYSDLTVYETELGKAFQRLNTECPDFVTPHVYTQNAAFNQSIVVGDSLLGISLDKYMGANYAPYRQFFFENQRVTMEPQRIVQDCLHFYLAQQYILPQMKQFPHPTLLEMMLHQGKISWVVSQLTNHSLLDIAAVIPATKKWYADHEQQVWQTISRPTSLNNADSAFIHSILWTNDARPYFQSPHSRGVGMWIGMRIIDSYMKHNKRVSINELLHDTDYTQLLKKSHYQPEATTR